MQPETAKLLKHRIESIDILRGLIMIIMAVDHTRDYLHLGHPDPTDLHTTTPILFFTRWITHFCAPIFVFLSGISAYLAGTRRTKAELSSFLIKRGLWLIFVELVVIAFAMTLDIGYHLFVLQVIWAIGGSMIILGLLIWLPLPIIGIIGGIIFAGHNIFDLVNAGAIENTLFWKLLVSSRGFSSFSPISTTRNILVAYALLPWTGVMLTGYVFGSLYQKISDPAKRKRVLLVSGIIALLLFVVLRAFNIYGDPSPWVVQKTTALSIISFFNVTKYPCSLIYLCMTLGPALIFLALTEQIKNRVTNVLMVYGSVPFFYYICHWYLIRLITILSLTGTKFTIKDIIAFDSPADFGYTLPVVYLIWLAVVVILYFPCRWFGKYKRSHSQWWLSYL